MYRSLYFDQNEILEAIRDLHCPEGYQCDITYGNGGFWKKIPRPRFCLDKTPLQDHVIEADASGHIPYPDKYLSNIVCDLPFVTYVKKGRDHKDGKVIMSQRFGGYYTYDDLLNDYKKTIKECHRVLSRKGILVFKCQDIVHNHKLCATHIKSVEMAEKAGFRLKDLFVLGAKHRMAGPQKGQQRHARVWHSYFLVFEKL